VDIFLILFLRKDTSFSLKEQKNGGKFVWKQKTLYLRSRFPAIRSDEPGMALSEIKKKRYARLVKLKPEKFHRKGKEVT